MFAHNHFILMLMLIENSQSRPFSKTLYHMITWSSRPACVRVFMSVWRMFDYACCNGLLFPVDVQYSIVKRLGWYWHCLRTWSADWSRYIRLVFILNWNKEKHWCKRVTALCCYVHTEQFNFLVINYPQKDQCTSTLVLIDEALNSIWSASSV